MISYKDRTFCASDCTQTRCLRYFGDEEGAAAKLWWGSDDYPVALSDFSPICEDYKPPK